MRCPACNGVNLVMSERQGVEIDYCPECRGVWLDRGELDKIIERSGAHQAQERGQAHAPRPHQEYSGHGHSYSHNQGHSHGHKKRESFLSDLFDF